MRTLVPLAFGLALAGCGGGAEAVPVPAAAPRTVRVAPSPPAPADVGEHKLTRSGVHDAVSMGLGAFLQHVTVDEQPVRVGGKFHGFRIAALADGPFWTGVDLRPGDVVTSVNGFPIERPEQAQTAFESLEVASELRVTYERDGQPHELVYAIVEDR
jgi:type II secretory pathway component PulC